ncbi:LOG family protein [Chlamydia sp. 17-3921]|uniref:LOG family protein n=1 Tax=Chlamydia sp. 17-3921 TaxID=2675798 RepID=UPI00191A7724|nr:LOG family protein [Chlamydia sp. 17-3921]
MGHLIHSHHDAISPDGYLCSPLKMLSQNLYEGEAKIQNIPEYFLGFHLPQYCLQLNLKSSLAQLGIEALMLNCELDKNRREAQIQLHFYSKDPVATAMLSLLEPGSFFGKLFAADDRRLVRLPCYLERMLNYQDRDGSPLLRFGKKLENLITFDVIDNRLVASLPTLPGIVTYEQTIYGFLPFISKALSRPGLQVRKFLSLYQHHQNQKKIPQAQKILLIKTEPLHIRTVFARVVQDLLPKGLNHTAANILEPTTQESGDIYEFYGDASESIERIPLEFFTIEPYKEYSFFSHRDLLQTSLDSEEEVFKIFHSAPEGKEKTATFISKGSEISNLQPSSWLVSTNTSILNDNDPKLIEKCIQQEPYYPFLEAMETGKITSQGVLFSRYFPSSWLKGMFLSYYVADSLKRIYFQFPSYSHGIYFSQRDRSFLLDLDLSGISVFWVDLNSRSVLQYIKRRNKDVGMFVPPHQIEKFQKAYFIGIHGSSILFGNSEQLLRELLQGIQALSQKYRLPNLPENASLAIMTGGGTGVMTLSNRIAKELSLLSCGNLASIEYTSELAESTNSYVEAKMTYRLDSLFERQADFHVDLAIFLLGGVGTDFELALELVSLKTKKKAPVPVFLIGPEDYWTEKISSLYKINIAGGTIQGSEWIYNCLFCISSAEAGIRVFHDYLLQTLPIGPEYPPPEKGFTVV